MKTFICSAEVVNIYNNGENFLQRVYKASNLQQAQTGFIQYLKSNRNLNTFSNITVNEAL